MQDVKMHDKFCVQVVSTYSVKRVISRVDTLYISMSCVFSGPVLHENQCLRNQSHYVKRDTRPDCRAGLQGLCDPATLYNVGEGGNAASVDSKK